MVDDTLGPEHSSFPDFYVDELWNLYDAALVMMAKLPVMAAAVSHEELATVIRDLWGQASHAAEELKAKLSHFTGPARAHAAELEALIGVAERRFAGWPPGDSRDVAVSMIVRTAIHMAIPGCELAIILAEVVGFPQHVGDLQTLRDRMLATDENLRRIGEQRIRRLG